MSDATAHHHDTDSVDVFGFWLYILTDCILFASLFATFAVLHKNTYGGIGIRETISLPYVFVETMLLLASSFTYGLAMLGTYRNSTKTVVSWLLLTFLFGAGFVGMEINEFVHMVAEGHAWYANGALSSFFALVATHGLHVSIGLIWMMIMIIQVCRLGPTSANKRRLTYLGLFWHFLDIVWIFVFTIVYLMGAI